MFSICELDDRETARLQRSSVDLEESNRSPSVARWVLGVGFPSSRSRGDDCFPATTTLVVVATKQGLIAQVRALGPREYALRAPGMSEELRVTTNPDFYEEHAESAEFWSPGSPLFIPPEHVEVSNEVTPERRLRELLDKS